MSPCCRCGTPVPPERMESLFCSKRCKAKYAKDPPQAITCGYCDAQADGIREAEQAGWRDIELDIEGFSWNYLGTCPECAEGEVV